MRDFLIWTGATLGISGLGFGLLMLTPFGAPIIAAVSAFLGTKIGRIALLVGTAGLALVYVMAKERKAGAEAERGKLIKANAAAKADRVKVDAAAEAETDAQLRAELSRYSPKETRP